MWRRKKSQPSLLNPSHRLREHSRSFSENILENNIFWTCTLSLHSLCISSFVFKKFPMKKRSFDFQLALYYLLYNIFLPEMYRSAFCHPFLSVGVSISFDVIILLYYNFIYFQDKDTFLRFYSRSFQTFSIYGCAASNADVILLRVVTKRDIKSLNISL